METTTEFQNAGFGGPGFNSGSGISPVGVVGLVNRGDGDGCNKALFIMNKLGDVQNDVRDAVSGLKDVTQNQTFFLQRGLCEIAQEVQKAVCSVKEKVDLESDRTRALINDINREGLNRALSDAKNEIIELRTEGRGRQFARETEINVTQNVNQQQTQTQFQVQIQSLADMIKHLSGDIQLIKQGQVIFNSGTMAASGTQAAIPTKVG